MKVTRKDNKLVVEMEINEGSTQVSPSGKTYNLGSDRTKESGANGEFTVALNVYQAVGDRK